jgi:hypothetical protein
MTATDHDQELRQRLAEVRRCRASLAHFCNNYCHILASDDRAGAWVPFRLWPAQEEVAHDLEAHREIVALKARQLGLTWLVIAFALQRLLFHPIATVLLFSKRDDEARELLDFRLREMFRRLPQWMRTEALAADTTHKLELPGGSRALAFSTTGGRSYTATLAVIDEADHVPDLERMLAAVKPTVDAGGRLVLLSTADKSQPESTFKRVYRAARAGQNDYHPVFHGWRAAPWRTDAWYEQQRRTILAQTGALDDLHQEYPATDAEALAPRSLDKRLPAEWLNKCYQDRTPPPPPPDAPAVAGLEVYAPPRPNRRYVLGCDPAEGNPTSDDSALEVLDAETGEECAALAGRFDPTVFAGHAAAVSSWYNRAAALVERNNHGHAVLLWLRDNTRVDLLRDVDGKDGWNTTSKSKAQLWTTAADAFRGGATALHSFPTFTQLASIEGATLRAPEGQKDDRAVAYGLALVAVTLDEPPDFNIRVFDLSPQPLTTRSPEPTVPQVRWFAPNQKWQPQPVIWGEQLLGAPDWRSEQEATLFVKRTHEVLGSPPPDCGPFEIDPEKAAAVEKAVTAFLKAKRLLPLTTT